MAGVCKLAIVLCVSSSVCCGEIMANGSTATAETDSYNHSSPIPTIEASTQSTTTRRPVTYACPTDITVGHTCYEQCEEYVWVRTLYCHCDPLCMRYEDCCPDYEDFCENQAEEVEDPPLDSLTKCIQTTEFDPRVSRPRSGHYLVARCPSNWLGDSAIRELCQEANTMFGIVAFPVEGTDGLHYRNIYCALCHGLQRGNLTFWSVSFEEKRYDDLRYLNSSQLLDIAKETTPNPIVKRIYSPPGYTDRDTFTPHLVTSSLRSCVILSPTGPCRFGDSHTQAICDQYNAPIPFNGTTYKNLACVQCNISPTREMNIYGMCDSLRESWEPRTGHMVSPLSMATLLVFADHTGNSGAGETNAAKCHDNQIYDPIIDLCRALTCPEGYALQGERCSQIIQDSAADSMVNIKITLIVTGSFHNTSVEDHSSDVDDMWSAIAYKTVDDFGSSVPVCNMEANGITRQQEDGSSSCHHVIITWACSSIRDSIHLANECIINNVFTCNVNLSFSTVEPPPMDEIIESSKTLLEKCFRGNIWNHRIGVHYLAVSARCGTPGNTSSGATPDSNFDESNLTSEVSYIWDAHSGLFEVSQNATCSNIDCPLVTFSEDEYVMTGALNDSIRLKQDDRVFQAGEFTLKKNGEVQVCNFLQFITSAPSISSVWDYAHTILTVTGSVLSLLGLVVIFVTYITFPILRRNAAGKSLMCLVASLFFAQLTMLVGLERTDVIAVCTAFAIASHFLWLSAFSWMNILAIDIYRTFGIGTAIINPSNRSFRYYALYGLAAPSLIVCTCVILSFCDCVELDIHYGSEFSCWIGNGMANLLSFGVPVLLILACNVVLFSLTVAGVMKTRNTSKRMNVTQGQQGDAASKRTRTDLILYLKLTAIMGFTWIFGFVASFSGVQILWYPFIILNSLQGAFICLAFVCNQRVIAMWKDRVMGSQDRQHTGTTASTSRQQRPHHSNKPSGSNATTKDDTEQTKV